MPEQGTENTQMHSPVGQQIPVVRLNDFKTMYVNHMRLRVSPSDLGVTFGYIDEVMPGLPVAQEGVSVIFSPFIAKSFSKILADTVSLFEEKYGEIKTPSTEPLDAAKMREIIATHVQGTSSE